MQRLAAPGPARSLRRANQRATSGSSIASIVGDTFHDPTLYLVISAVFLVVLLIVLFTAFRPKPVAADADGVEVIDLENRHGLGYLMINVVGTVLSAPAAIFGGSGKSNAGK